MGEKPKWHGMGAKQCFRSIRNLDSSPPVYNDPWRVPNKREEIVARKVVKYNVQE
jgi:hypothetical protein